MALCRACSFLEPQKSDPVKAALPSHATTYRKRSKVVHSRVAAEFHSSAEHHNPMEMSHGGRTTRCFAEGP